MAAIAPAASASAASAASSAVRRGRPPVAGVGLGVGGDAAVRGQRASRGREAGDGAASRGREAGDGAASRGREAGATGAGTASRRRVAAVGSGSAPPRAPSRRSTRSPALAGRSSGALAMPAWSTVPTAAGSRATALASGTVASTWARAWAAGCSAWNGRAPVSSS